MSLDNLYTYWYKKQAKEPYIEGSTNTRIFSNHSIVKCITVNLYREYKFLSDIQPLLLLNLYNK